MKVAVIGANGKIARFLIDKLAKLPKEFEATAIIRNPDQVQQFQDIGVHAKVASITDSVASITKAIAGFDAIVFSAGAGGKGGLDMTLMVDLDGAVKVMEAAEAANIKRFIMVSALKADTREFFYPTGLRSYYICKMYADRELRRTDLDYTILRPGMLTDGPGTSKLLNVMSDTEPLKEGVKPHIEREDVATAIVETLRNKNTIRKVIPLINGDMPTAEFISKF